MPVTIFNGHLVQIYRISNENKRLVIGAQTKECNQWIIAVIIGPSEVSATSGATLQTPLSVRPSVCLSVPNFVMST